jgi:S-adenosylmethionine-diacylglycerol 3-amino-3-carboxypropyl transferase
VTDLYFAQIREDSMVERTLADRYRPKTVAVIGSGGCTAFSLLRDDVQTIYAIDFNPAQAALIELKKAAIGTMSREEYLAFAGETDGARESDGSDRQETYRRLAPLLPDYARTFWDSHPHLLALGVNQCGATERFYRFISQNIRFNLYGDEVWQELLSCRTLDEQAAFRERYLNTDAWHTAVRLLLSKTTHLQFFPAHMFAQAREQDFGAFFEAMFNRELERRLIGHNYFFTQLMFGTYLLDRPEGAPHYLSEEGYASAKRNLYKLRVLPLSLQQALPQMQGIDAFFLSNVFDWSDEAQRAAICAAVLEAKSREAVLLYRNMLSAPPLPEAFYEQLAVDEACSREMTDLDRSMMYQRITVGALK